MTDSGNTVCDRALAILHRMGTERTGRERFLRRWYYSDEPLRNDAANLVREAGFQMRLPENTQLVGTPPRSHRGWLERFFDHLQRMGERRENRRELRRK